MLGSLTLHKFPGSPGGGRVFVELVVTVMHVNKSFPVVVEPEIPFALQINQLQLMRFI
jgi:hypothetical protein